MTDQSTLRTCSLCNEGYRDSTGHDYVKCVERLDDRLMAAAARVGELTRSLAQARLYLKFQGDGTIDPYPRGKA